MEQRLDNHWKTIKYPIDKEYWMQQVREGRKHQWEVDLENFVASDNTIWYTEVTRIYLDAIANYKRAFDKNFHCRLFFVKVMPEDYYGKYPVLDKTAVIWNVTDGLNKKSKHKIVGQNKEGSIAMKVETTSPLLIDMSCLQTICDKQRRDLVLTFNAPFKEVFNAWRSDR